MKRIQHYNQWVSFHKELSSQWTFSFVNHGWHIATNIGNSDETAQRSRMGVFWQRTRIAANIGNSEGWNSTAIKNRSETPIAATKKFSCCQPLFAAMRVTYTTYSHSHYNQVNHGHRRLSDILSKRGWGCLLISSKNFFFFRPSPGSVCLVSDNRPTDNRMAQKKKKKRASQSYEAPSRRETWTNARPIAAIMCS